MSAAVWTEKRTEGVVVDGDLYLPPNACAECDKWFPPYQAAVPGETADLYCWGHETDRAFERLLAVLDDLPAVFRAERQRRGVTAAQAAYDVGYGRYDMSRFENGKTVPRLEVVRRMLAWLGPDVLRDAATKNGRTGGDDAQ